MSRKVTWRIIEGALLFGIVAILLLLVLPAIPPPQDATVEANGPEPEGIYEAGQVIWIGGGVDATFGVPWKVTYIEDSEHEVGLWIFTGYFKGGITALPFDQYK